MNRIVRMIFFGLAYCLVFAPLAAGLPSPFAVVFVDAKTEATLGQFPYDRAVLADALTLLKKSGASAVVMKFFLDLPKSQTGDRKLASVMKTLPVILQASVAYESRPNLLDSRFDYRGFSGDDKGLLSGDSGWIPLPVFQDACADVGFADIRNRSKPLLWPVAEKQDGRVVKSLALAVLEHFFGTSAVIAGKYLRLNGHSLPLDSRSEIEIRLPASTDIDSSSFSDLFEPDADLRKYRDKIVIIGYDGKKQEFFDTPSGRISAHRLFCLGLFDLYVRLRKEDKSESQN